MKLKSLILGSAAAVGLSTAGFAADLGVLTSLDVCDALGISGLTISSDTNCLQISGGVSYQFRWGDYRDRNAANTANLLNLYAVTPVGSLDTITAGGVAGTDVNPLDYESKVEAWLKFVGTADSDFGPASATIKLKSISQDRYWNEGEFFSVVDDTSGFGTEDSIDEAYVSIGDSTVIMAGKKGSIANFGDAQPFNYLRTFGYSDIDTGVLFQDDEDEDYTGNHVIQIVSDLGNGVSVAAGLENLNGEYDPAGVNGFGAAVSGTAGTAAGAGTAVGVVSYAGEGITAHITGLAVGILDGQAEEWGVHAGATGTFDMFKVRGAIAYRGADYTDFGGAETNALHALLTASATFDMFTIAASGEYLRTENETAGIENDAFGFGGSIGATVTDGITINLGARYLSSDFDPLDARFDNDAFQVSAQLVAALTETIKATGEIGAYFNDVTLNDPTIIDSEDELYYGSLGLAWAPGGGFTSSVVGEVNSQGAYRATFNAAKTFE